MDPARFIVSHGGYGLEVTLLEYISRVVLHLLGLAGAAVLVFLGIDAVEAVRSAFVAERDGEANER